MNIQEAIKVNTVIHCETEEEAIRILNMAHELGYKWSTGEKFTSIDNNWDVHEEAICYYIIDGSYGNIKYAKNANYTIINSTEITDMTTDCSSAPEDIEAMNKKTSEKRPIDKVTTKNLDIALRMVGIQLDVSIIDKIIDLVELIENKGDYVTIKDIVSLQQTWKRHLLKYGPILIC